MSLIHRAGTALLSTALAVTLVGGSATARPSAQAPATQAPATQAPATQAPATQAPATQGADWLTGQLHDGLVHNGQFHFDDYGLTIDTAFALNAIGGHGSAVRQIRHALAQHVDSYTTGVDFGSPTDRYAGAIAKLLVAAQDTGGMARHFGGVNLVNRLSQRVSTTAPTVGRIEDASGFGDNANTIGQIFAVRGLLRAHSPLAASALRFLVEQQCGPGFLRLDFDSDKTAADQGCTRTSTADTDVTALAVVELWRFRKHSGGLGRMLDTASRWLGKHQAKDGSFGGGGPTAAANTNSTGLAGWAFTTAGRCVPAAAAASWIEAHQVSGDVSGTPLAGERGAVAYDHGAMKAARRDGITQTTRDQWRRATAQAAPALMALHPCPAT